MACTNNQKKLCGNENCKTCFNRSFASNNMSKFWNYKLNNNISPYNIRNGTNIKYWFNCNNCYHVFNKQINEISKGSWCPYCCKSSKKLCNNNNCDFCYNRSFSSHEKLLYFNYELNNPIDNLENIIYPRNIFKKSKKKYYFTCIECNHNFLSSPEIIVSLNGWCPYCSHQKLCDYINCNMCYNNSFASHEKSIYWNYELNNNIIPRQEFKNSTHKYNFDCYLCGNDFEISLEHINIGNWCSKCKNKTEKKLIDFFKTNKINFIHQYKVNWCINKNHLPFDFYLPDYNLIIECDGRQHFINLKIWKSNLKLNQIKDTYKMKCANEKNIYVIRIFQEDIYRNMNKWNSKLLNILKNNINENIYIGSKNIYDNYIKNIDEYYKLSNEKLLQLINN